MTTLATSSDKDVSTLHISVIVPVLNEEHFIGRTLEGLMGQEYHHGAFEILVVDGGSTDRTREVVQEFASRHSNIKLLDNPKKWSSAGRNVGIDAASGDVVIVVDGHCQFFDDQYLINVESAFRHEEIDCLGRPQPLDISDGTLIQEAIALARSSRLGHHPDSFIYAETEQVVPAHSVGVAYRKSVFDKIGKFDETFDACEDVELNHRADKAGLSCLLVPSIRLRYVPRANLKSLFRQMGRYGRGRLRLFRKHRDTFSMKSFIPAAFLAFLILGGLVSLFVPFVLLLYLVIVGLYIAVVMAFSVMLSLQAKKVPLLWALPLVFGAVHFGAGWGTLKELVLGKPFRWRSIGQVNVVPVCSDTVASRWKHIRTNSCHQRSC